MEMERETYFEEEEEALTETIFLRSLRLA